jgi:hypothetical protein
MLQKEKRSEKKVRKRKTTPAPETSNRPLKKPKQADIGCKRGRKSQKVLQSEVQDEEKQPEPVHVPEGQQPIQEQTSPPSGAKRRRITGKQKDPDCVKEESRPSLPDVKEEPGNLRQHVKIESGPLRLDGSMPDEEAEDAPPTLTPLVKAEIQEATLECRLKGTLQPSGCMDESLLCESIWCTCPCRRTCCKLYVTQARARIARLSPQ